MTQRLGVWFAVAWLAVAAPARGAGDDMRFLQGLRERRLFGLAEAHCQSRLADVQLSSPERAQLTTELIHVLADHAVHSAAEERPPLWQRAHHAAEDFQRRFADHPRLPLILVQDSLAFLAEGELARREAEVDPSAQQALDQARRTIRRAISLLERIDRRLTEMTPRAASASSRSGELTAAQLSSLQQNVRYHLAAAYRSRALCYPPRSADRVAALTEALDQFAKPLLELQHEDELVSRILFEQAICLRLLGNHDEYTRVLAELEKRPRSPAETLRLRAERARGQLSSGRLREALGTIRQGRELAGVVSPELDFAHLETYVALWRAAVEKGDNDAARQWQQKSIAAVEFIEQHHGSYWARRSELLLIGVGQGQGRSDGDLEILVRTADNLFLRGQIDDALLAYDKAAGAARASSLADLAFELAYKAALVEQHRGRHESASRRFRRLAVSAPGHAQAANAHLLAIGNSAELARTDSTKLSLYATMLEEHLGKWPGNRTANVVRIWLGQQYERQREWGLACATYGDVPNQAEQLKEAVEGARRCWMSWISERQSSGKPIDEVAEQAVAYFDRVVEQADSAEGIASRIAATTGAQLRLLHRPAQRLQAHQLLAAAASGDDQYSATARVLQVGALALLPGRASEAGEQFQLLPAPAVTDLVSLVGILAAAMETAAPTQRRDLAQLQLAVITRIAGLNQPLDPPTRRQLGLARAQALMARQQFADAIAVYDELAGQHADDFEVQRAYADALLQTDDRAHLQRALHRWRIVVSRSRPHTSQWLQGKYSVALTQYKMGDKGRAAKIIRYLQETEDLAAAGLAEQFQELLARCQR